MRFTGVLINNHFEELNFSLCFVCGPLGIVVATDKELNALWYIPVHHIFSSFVGTCTFLIVSEFHQELDDNHRDPPLRTQSLSAYWAPPILANHNQGRQIGLFIPIRDYR